MSSTLICSTNLSKVKPKSKPSSQNGPIIQAFAQKFEKFTTEVVQGQKALMNRMAVIERAQGSRANFPPKKQFKKDKSFPRKATNEDHTMQQNVPNSFSNQHGINLLRIPKRIVYGNS